MDYFFVFAVSFLSATVFPLGSEGLLLYYASDASISIFYLWLWASLGNTLGAVTNWLLGLYLRQYKEEKWFPVKKETRETAEQFFNRYGVFSIAYKLIAPNTFDGDNGPS